MESDALPSVVVAVLVVALTAGVGGLVVLALRRTQGVDPERATRPVASLPASPCAEPWGPRSSADTVAFLCDGTAFAAADGETTAIGTDVVALDTLDGEIIAATRTPDCDGLLLTSLTSDTDPLARATADAATPAALAITPDAVLLWTGDDLTTVPR